MDREVSLLDILRILLRRWWIIALAAIFFAIGTFVYSHFFITKQYSSSGTLYVDTSVNGRPQDLSSVNLSKQLVNSYAEILQSVLYSEIVSSKLAADGYPYPAAVVKRSLKITPVEDTEIMKLTVTYTDPDDARIILQSILDNAPEGIQKVAKTGVVSKLDNASFSSNHVSPNVSQNTVFGGAFGAFVAAWIIYLLSYFDRKIKHEDDLAKKYNLPVLGIIPDLEEK